MMNFKSKNNHDGTKKILSSLKLQILADLIFSEDFLEILVKQMNSYTAQEIAKLKKVKKKNIIRET